MFNIATQRTQSVLLSSDNQMELFKDKGIVCDSSAQLILHILILTWLRAKLTLKAREYSEFLTRLTLFVPHLRHGLPASFFPSRLLFSFPPFHPFFSFTPSLPSLYLSAIITYLSVIITYCCNIRGLRKQDTAEENTGCPYRSR